MSETHARHVFDPPIDGGVVVGHDGSPSADRALRWGADEARAHGWPLHVVRAWKISDAPRPADVAPGIVPTEDEFDTAVCEAVRADVERVLGGDASLVTAVHAVHAAGEHALVAASSHASVVVVGSKGRGRIAERLLGSTSRHVVEHADCPVTVLRG